MFIFFTALAQWNENKVKKHKQYIKALETTGVKVIYGKFKKITKKCRECFKQYTTFEEKQTDVNIGLHLLNLCYKDKFDKYLLFTADSDLIPAVKMLQKHFPNKQSHIILPMHAKSELKNISSQFSKITEKHLKYNLFSDTIHSDGEIITKPKGW